MYIYMGFPGGSDGKKSACIVGDPGSIPESGRSPREGNGYLFWSSCLENPMDRRALQATVHRVTESDTIEQLTLSHTHIYMYVCICMHACTHTHTHTIPVVFTQFWGVGEDLQILSERCQMFPEEQNPLS